MRERVRADKWAQCLRHYGECKGHLRGRLLGLNGGIRVVCLVSRSFLWNRSFMVAVRYHNISFRNDLLVC